MAEKTASRPDEGTITYSEWIEELLGRDEGRPGRPALERAAKRAGTTAAQLMHVYAGRRVAGTKLISGIYRASDRRVSLAHMIELAEAARRARARERAAA